MRELIKVDKNGSKHWRVMVTCDRCGGQGGSPAWQYTGFTCYKCGGTGRVETTLIERTPEYEAKLEARRAKRQAKAQAEYEAKQAELEAQRLEQERINAERKAAEEARKAISQCVGEIGQRITIEIVEHYTATFESHIGWKEVLMRIHVMRDASGNVYTWKTQNTLGYDESNDQYIRWHSIQEDEHFLLTGTIKDHSEYKGEKQTVLTRCKVKGGAHEKTLLGQ